MTDNKKKNKKISSADLERNKRMKRIAVSLAVICFFAVAGLSTWSILFSGMAPSSAVVRIPANATKDQLRDSIAYYLGEPYAKKVSRLVGLRGTDLGTRHGAYLIEAGMSPLTAMRRLTGGPQEPLTITINGFRLLPVLEEKVSARFDFTSDSLAALLSDPAALNEYGLTPGQALALFINDSYEFYWNASPAEVVRKIGAHYNDVWTPARQAKAKALGLTPAEVMTVASIVDEETNKLDEKGTVGRLYINRLNRGMRLEADPTVRYAGGDFTVKRVKNPRSIESPYNTYIHPGLPPGPIRTTSVETIDAILDSKPHDYIFMCAKEDFSGYHNFAATYSEHQANARRYKRELDRRGIY
ncbi:MAG: endolytic transglycosylase MltG [Muribaculaceae bacterium]|nr:endolytic transglycosylase MltG [Muribaculaceae bacterium]